MTEVKAQGRNNAQLFLSGLDSIRISLKIPGMEVAVMKEDSTLLNDGLGYADLKNKIKVTPNTTFRIASITKTFTSTLIMQLVEQGKLYLQTPISKFGIELGEPNITVKNLLTHTSEIEPGKYYQYNGYRYGKLGQVIEKASGIPFYQLLMQNIVKPLNMNFTAPGLPIHDSLFKFDVYTKNYPEMLPFFENSFSHLAKAYDVNDKGEIVETQYLDEFGAFGGLATDVTDLLKYSKAIDSNEFVSAKTQQEIFTANRTTNGETTPYGLGWFTQNYKGIDFYWHYGQTQGESGLFVKVPSMKLTLAVLTNSIKLSSPFPLGDGDLLMSPVGQLFYKCFVNKDDAVFGIDFSQTINEIRKEIKKHFKSEYKDFYNKEIISEATIDNFKGDTASAKKLYNLYAELNFKNIRIRKYNSILAQINYVGINQEISKKFVLKKSTKIQITGIGENCSGDFKSWCDYGWIEDTAGKIIWQMQAQPAVPAGGAVKNQKVETVITLLAGTYILKYKSDSGHAYDNWDSLPPDNFIWGITLSLID